jgi:hypothetical protein
LNRVAIRVQTMFCNCHLSSLSAENHGCSREWSRQRTNSPVARIVR